MDAFEKYNILAEQGATPNEVSLIAKADGLNFIERIKLVRRFLGYR